MAHVDSASSVPMPAQPFSLCASDLDGTLLTSTFDISPFTKETIYQVEKARQARFVLATGRHYLSVHLVRESLVAYFVDKQKAGEGVQNGGSASADDTPGFYLVSSNGARIHDSTGKLIYERNLDPDIVEALYKDFGLPYTKKRYAGPVGMATPPPPTAPVTLDEATGQYVSAHAGHGGGADGLATQCAEQEPEGADTIHANDEEPAGVVSTSAYTTDNWFITASFLPDEEMLKKFGFVPLCLPFDSHAEENKGRSIFDTFPTTGVGKVCFRCSNKDILNYLERAIMEKFAGRVTVALSSSFCLDVMAAGVSKASALQAVVGKLGLRMADIIAFGDGLNDYEMLSSVGKGCIMQNAHPRLKRAMPEAEVIGHHDDDAVAKKLREVFDL